ncbi:hypothetical protein D3C71_775540 [compost metagenome]
MVRAFNFLNIVEAAYRHGIRAIRQTSQHTRHHQTEITGIIGVAEGFPFDIFGAVKVIADIFDGRHIFHRVFIEELRSRRADKRHMGRRRHFRDVTHQRHVLRAGIKFIRRNHRRERLTTRGIVLRNVRMPV